LACVRFRPQVPLSPLHSPLLRKDRHSLGSGSRHVAPSGDRWQHCPELGLELSSRAPCFCRLWFCPAQARADL
jgi:hypothetical protein